MATILLLDSDIRRRESIALVLRSHGHNVLPVESHVESLAMIDSRIPEIDVALVGTINGDEMLWRQLEHIYRLRRKDGLPPLIILFIEGIANKSK